MMADFQFKLSFASQDTNELVAYALQALKKICHEGYVYKKAGVILHDLIPPWARQVDLFGWTAVRQDRVQESERLMKALDKVNEKLGRDTLYLAGMGHGGNGKLKKQKGDNRQEHLSPIYTTN